MMHSLFYSFFYFCDEVCCSTLMCMTPLTTHCNSRHTVSGRGGAEPLGGGGGGGGERGRLERERERLEREEASLRMAVEQMKRDNAQLRQNIARLGMVLVLSCVMKEG